MMGYLHIAAFVLVIVGALNWGLIGFFGYNLIESLGLTGGVVDMVYVLVGLSAIYLVLGHQTDCKTCMTMMGGKKKRR